MRAGNRLGFLHPTICDPPSEPTARYQRNESQGCLCPDPGAEKAKEPGRILTRSTRPLRYVSSDFGECPRDILVPWADFRVVLEKQGQAVRPSQVPAHQHRCSKLPDRGFVFSGRNHPLEYTSSILSAWYMTPGRERCLVRDERAANKLEMMYPRYGWLPEHFFQRIPGQCLNSADTESSLTGLCSPVAGLPASG